VKRRCAWAGCGEPAVQFLIRRLKDRNGGPPRAEARCGRHRVCGEADGSVEVAPEELDAWEIHES
jgi:hypothetical protein